MRDESELIEALGISDLDDILDEMGEEKEEPLSSSEYNVVPNPVADELDLSKLRGVANDENTKNRFKDDDMHNSESDLQNLAEILPDIAHRRPKENPDALLTGNDKGNDDDDGDGEPNRKRLADKRKMSVVTRPSTDARRMSLDIHDELNRNESMKVHHTQGSKDVKEYTKLRKSAPAGAVAGTGDRAANGGSSKNHDESLEDYPDSDQVLDDEPSESQSKVPKEFHNLSSGQSISTATQTHDVIMPMYLPTFKPATNCTNASDFIVRCFVARLRSGITVVKHGRSRWCKSRLRILHIHPDGRSLSWKPAEGEPTSNKRPPKLDLSTCTEVRHAWSPDPQNPMYTGTTILRQKCEAANAHKSFALIFKHRTVDITAVTADQCKVLMEGFSALCFRLQVANLAGQGSKRAAHARPMPEEDGVSTTASVTLTNSSTPRAR